MKIQFPLEIELESVNCNILGVKTTKQTLWTSVNAETIDDFSC